MTQPTNNKTIKNTKPITLEQTIDKVRELNKEVRGLKELLLSIMTHIEHTYGYIQQIGDILGTAKVEHIPDDKAKLIETYKNKIMKEN